MSAVEVFAIVFFGVIGYLIVSHLWDRFTATRSSSANTQHDAADDGSDPQTQRSDASAPRAWWQVLGVAPGASAQEIHDAYRREISKYHPDRVAHLADEFKVIAEMRSKEITAAFREGMRGCGASA